MMIEFFIDNIGEIFEQTIEHIWITVVAMVIAITIGVSLGIMLSRMKKATGPVIGLVGIFQTIPSLALLGFMIPIFGIGVVPAIIALFLYALLPIVRNTHAGIIEVDPAIKEAAIGMGMTNMQLLTRVELPLAIPVIFAGVRTAFVINVGVATLCALIAAGGLGEFIFRGISLNNVNMIVAGAVPAALLALGFDFLMGKLQHKVQQWIKQVLIGFGVVIVLVLTFLLFAQDRTNEFTGGFPSEFIHREDGFKGLSEKYNLSIASRELDAGLMYEALRDKEVDIVSGYSTDGRIKAYDLVTLEDDLHYFPPYFAAPIVRGSTLRKYPELISVFNLIAGKISETDMASMNYEVDEKKRSPRAVAEEFLKSMDLPVETNRTGEGDIVVGSKNFTESYILAELFDLLIENQTGLTVSLKLGFGGTKLNFDALANGDIDMYPEYTGTALMLLLKPDKKIVDSLIVDEDMVFNYVKQRSAKEHDFEWLAPFGFNNTFAMLMRREDVEGKGITTLSDLSRVLEEK